MINRRAAIGGAFCVAAAAAAAQLKPHKYVSLLHSAKLDDIVPRSFGTWTSQDVGDPLALNDPGTLSAKLYNQLITRAYTNGEKQQLLMLLAHGERQSDELQLHRPEVCYPAFGYKLLENQPTQLSFGAAAPLPARQLVAKSPNDQERVIYWTRLGEYFPTSTKEQRKARFNNTVAGIIPDGLLCRFSMLDADQADRIMTGFLRELIAATGGPGRSVLVGTQRMRQLAQTA